MKIRILTVVLVSLLLMGGKCSNGGNDNDNEYINPFTPPDNQGQSSDPIPAPIPDPEPEPEPDDPNDPIPTPDDDNDPPEEGAGNDGGSPTTPVEPEDPNEPDIDALPEWARWLTRVNDTRTAGVTCGGFPQGTLEMPPVKAVSWDANLEAAALRHAKDLNKHTLCGHIGTDGSRFWDRAAQEGFAGRARVENAACGFRIYKNVQSAWIIDAGVPGLGHCRNLMNANLTHIGIARDGGYWVLVGGSCPGCPISDPPGEGE